MHWTRISTLLATLAAAALALSCSDRPTPTQQAAADARAMAPVASVAPDGPSHGPTGAIFTTTPDGGKVNENVHYPDKLWVYLDGGPRNDNPNAAGLDDGWYIFQITDPSGKYLLSMDPAKCRVVEVEGGVIQRLVPPSQMGLGLTDTYGKPAVPCHIQDSPDGVYGPSGQHDTNTDSDPGGGIVVQMMPFGTTPNPGGEYKAWVTTWGAYKAKVGVSGLATALNAMPDKTNGKASQPCPDFCAAPDPGFAPPRNLQKTDNFKVKEAPPFIRIAKLVDLTRNGPSADDTLYKAGWQMTVGEPIWDGSEVTNEHITGPSGYTEPIPVPSNTTVKVCERLVAGWQFTYAQIGNTTVTASPFTVDTLHFMCINVPVGPGKPTIQIAFGNYPIQPKARIKITPDTGTNFLPYTHTLKAKVEVDSDLVATPTWVPAPNGTTVYFRILSGTGGTLSPTSCTTVSGTCSVSLTSTATGKMTIQDSARVIIGTDTLSVKSDGTGNNSAPAVKIWINAKIEISPLNDTNSINDLHVLTAKVQINYGVPNTYVNAPSGLRIDFTKVSGPGTLTSAYCLTAGTTGACKDTLNSSVAGTTVVKASATIDSALVAPYTSPDVPSGQHVDVVTNDTLPNSGPARKVWLSGTLIWTKVDMLGTRIAGATFEVCRTHNYVYGTGFTAITPVCVTVLDNTAPDVDPANGVFKLTALRLGRYAVHETIAPPNYIPDPDTLIANVISSTTVTIGPFVNNLNGRMTAGTGQVMLDLEDGSRFLTSGFTIHCDILLSNNLEINWKDETGSRKWHITKPIKTSKCTDNPDVRPGQPDALFDTFEGTAEGELDGVAGSWVQFVFVDAGEPGKKADLAWIKVWSGNIGSTVVMQVVGDQSIRGYSGLANIKGNIQAHLDQPHK